MLHTVYDSRTAISTQLYVANSTFARYIITYPPELVIIFDVL